MATTLQGNQPMKGVFSRWLWAMGWVTGLVLVAATVFSVSAHAQTNRLENVAVSKGSSGQTIVRFSLSSPISQAPAGFAIANPPRVALDFPGVANGLGGVRQAIDDDVLRSLNLIQSGGKTRVVMNLNKPQQFKTDLDGNMVVVMLTGELQDEATAASQQVQHFAEAKPGDIQHSLRDVDFRRGENGEGRVVVDLSDNSVGIDIRQQGKQLIVDFLKTDLPHNLARRLDVADFGTPVMTIDTFVQGNRTRMVIEPKGLWEHSAYQTDKQFALEIKPIVEDPNKLTQGSRQGYKGDKLSLNFQNVEVRAVLQVIADFTGLNIITSDTVQGNLTLRLKDIPWDQALDIIMQTKGLDMRKNGSVVLIAPRDELALKERQQFEAMQQIGDLEPLQTEMFQMNYQKAQNLQKLLSDPNQKFLSKRGTAVVDERTNILFVQDTAVRLEEVRQLIRRIDITVRQVLIEARIVIASDSFSRKLGVRFGSQAGFSFNNYAVGTTGSLSTAPTVTVNTDGTTTRETRTPTPFEIASRTTRGAGFPGYSDRGGLNVDLPVGNPAGSLAMTLINLGSGNLVNLELSALEADKRGKVVSSPRVVTADNQTAVIEQGTEIPYVTPGSANSPATVSFKKAVLRLEVTPQITPDNRVIMNIDIRKDTVGQRVQLGGGFEVPSVDTKNVTTQISVNNGDTAVIGGIYEEEVLNDVDKVPYLGDIPLLGYLFKTTGRSSNKTELLVFLTPRIVKETVETVR
ncbi:MAG: type IV pilus secretin PilQ [Burkholderiales bacterium]|jgi:type IV pilus assembly protein PilQ|nr:type IV pilus secretin PilQ [Burkholderiales bacterium]